MTQEELNQKLLDAVYKDNIGGVKKTLSLGANVNAADDNGCTSLILACANGHTDIVRLFFKCGIDINTIDKSRYEY